MKKMLAAAVVAVSILATLPGNARAEWVASGGSWAWTPDDSQPVAADVVDQGQWVQQTRQVPRQVTRTVVRQVKQCQTDRFGNVISCAVVPVTEQVTETVIQTVVDWVWQPSAASAAASGPACATGNCATGNSSAASSSATRVTPVRSVAKGAGKVITAPFRLFGRLFHRGGSSCGQ